MLINKIKANRNPYTAVRFGYHPGVIQKVAPEIFTKKTNDQKFMKRVLFFVESSVFAFSIS